MKFIHVGGARGVGKTTVLSQLNSTNVKIISTSRFLYSLTRTYLQKEWEDTNNEERVVLRKNAVDEMSKLKDEIVILDSHYVDIDNGFPVIIFPQELSKLVECHIVIESSPVSILSRRVADNINIRDLVLRTIEAEVQAEKHIAMEIAKENNAIFQLIQNEYVYDTSKKIDSIIESIKSL